MQGSVKFYCLKTGCVLKRRLFTPMPMPDLVIKRVNTIGARKRQGQDFWFLNQKKEPYEWTDEVPEDDPEFQGLLEELAQYPDVLAKLPGVELECELADDQVVTDEPEPNFAELVVAALKNVGIDPHDRLQSVQAAAAAARPQEPALIEANDDKIVYEIILDLPDAGLIQPDPSHNDGAHVAPAAHIVNDVHNLSAETVDLLTNEPRRYPTQLRV